MTAYENISLALSIAGTKPSEIEQRIPQIAQALNIQDVLGKYPYQMSGGQQQRVAAARAMVTNPAIVLADEPTGALVPILPECCLTMLTELNERLSATILMVTHDCFFCQLLHLHFVYQRWAGVQRTASWDGYAAKNFLQKFWK